MAAGLYKEGIFDEGNLSLLFNMITSEKYLKIDDIRNWLIALPDETRILSIELFDIIDLE